MRTHSRFYYFLLPSLVSIFIFEGCTSDGAVSYTLKFGKVSNLDTASTFSSSGCPESGTYCITPTDYRLGLQRVNFFDCNDTPCATLTESEYVSSDEAHFTSANISVGSIILGSTSDVGGTASNGMDKLGGVTMKLSYVEADLPDSTEIAATYRKATIRLCLVDGCNDVTGALRGDIVFKLSGQTSFKWIATSGVTSQGDELRSTRPASAQVNSAVASSSLTGVLFPASDIVIVPSSLSPVKTVTSNSVITLRADASKAIYCQFSSMECDPSNGVDVIRLKFPPTGISVDVDERTP